VARFFKIRQILLNEIQVKLYGPMEYAVCLLLVQIARIRIALRLFLLRALQVDIS
jgi:hypothetical protein